MALLVSSALFWVAVAGATYPVTDGGGLGPRYDGVGGLSGGGATSRLLVDYDEPYRSQILDLLFLPNFGASLQVLKIEVGGDGQSTEGTEASHMHAVDDFSMDRGYEMFIAKEGEEYSASTTQPLALINAAVLLNNPRRTWCPHRLTMSTTTALARN